jgi:pyruvate kinase
MNRKTKIVCTIGPKTCEYEQLKQLAIGGMNVVRLNMSHGTHEWHSAVIEKVKLLRTEGFNLALMLDTKGPEIRSGDVALPLVLKAGDNLTFTIHKLTEYPENTVSINYDGFVNDVDVGDVILVDGGVMSLAVVHKTTEEIKTEVLEDGTLTSRRHLNIRGKSAKLPTLTEKDWEDIDFGITQEINYYALSFVNSAEPLITLRKYLESKNSPAKVLSKIESTDAMDHLEEIIEASDAVMVARGDLGAELPVEEVPGAQTRIVELSRAMGKPVIVATQLLESMMVSPTPTRAEVTDIYYAVKQRADAIMMSGETANGNYPFKALEVMSTVALKAESTILSDKRITAELPDTVKGEMALGASVIANNLDSDAIIVFSTTGETANYISQARPNSPVFVFTANDSITRELSLNWGITSYTLPFNETNPEETIHSALEMLKGHNHIFRGNSVVIVSNIIATGGNVHAVQVREVI